MKRPAPRHSTYRERWALTHAARRAVERILVRRGLTLRVVRGLPPSEPPPEPFDAADTEPDLLSPNLWDTEVPGDTPPPPPPEEEDSPAWAPEDPSGSTVT
ncbi:MAG: hypothetical protein EBR40_03115 [Proteobacteria bacterium]|nr:hypothetical protein [Pseudomonadota bacterium]